MKVIPRWKWENIWLVFIVTACLVMPAAILGLGVPHLAVILGQLPATQLTIAAIFGFLWGFGAIFFGLSVDRLGVAVSNSLVLGLSSALGSLVPLVLSGSLRLEARQLVLFLGVAIFLLGVFLCGQAGQRRDQVAAGVGRASVSGYLFAAGAGVMSAVFNIGYSLALPIAVRGQELGLSSFMSTNLIWLVMLAAGSIPNICFCCWLLNTKKSARNFTTQEVGKTWGLSVLMGILWGASIFLYGAATPLLGDIGPSIGWPLSLAAGLVIANVMGYLLGEWKQTAPAAVRLMQGGVAALLAAMVVCGISTRL